MRLTGGSLPSVISDPKVQSLPVGGEPKAPSRPFLCISELERSAFALGFQMLMSALLVWLFSQQIDGAAARIDRSRVRFAGFLDCSRESQY